MMDKKQAIVAAVQAGTRGFTPAQVEEIMRLASRIDSINTQECNEELPQARETQRENAKDKIGALVNDAWKNTGDNFIVLFQGDPRGPAVRIFSKRYDFDRFKGQLSEGETFDLEWCDQHAHHAIAFW